MAIAGGETVVDRKMSRKFDNQFLLKFLFWGKTVVFDFWSNVKYASVVKLLYFCVSGVFFLLLILIFMIGGVSVGKLSLDSFCISFDVVRGKLVIKFCLGLAVNSTVSVSLSMSFAAVMFIFEEFFVDITELISEFFIPFCRFQFS